MISDAIKHDDASTYKYKHYKSRTYIENTGHDVFKCVMPDVMVVAVLSL